MRRATGRALLALAVTGGLGGCAEAATMSAVTPTCAPSSGGEVGNGVILMAQSVPTASWIPCIRTELPLGWGFHGLDARSSGSRFWLDSDRDGQRAIEVRLSSSCDVEGATEIPTDREGLRRLERVTQTVPEYIGERYYLFSGGCLTFAFRLAGDTPAEGLALATQSIGVVSRDYVRAHVRRDSGGRLSLDPDGSGSG